MINEVVNSELVFYNALAVSFASDYKKLSRLKEKHGSWSAAWKTTGNTRTDPEKEFCRLKEAGIKLILRDEPEFPAALREIPLPPLAIYLRGALPDNKISVSVVGTRKATPEGEDIAYDFSRSLASRGINIVSGLALGIDAAAHRGALKTGLTFAVLATGVDNPYPRLNKKLAEDILASGGGLISEYPPGSTAFPSRFLERNRIISGLSRAVVLIEAPERSGSLATARFALEQNREIFVVPGHPTHKNYRGSHALIREGARLTTSPEDILADLGLSGEKSSVLTPRAGSEEENAILEILRAQGPLPIDGIIDMVKLDTALTVEIVSSLTLAGMIEEKEDGYQIS